MKLPTAAIGDAYQNTAGWETLESLVDIENRMAGSSGEAKAMETLTAAFRECGLREVNTDRFEIPAWQRGSSTLLLPGRHSTYDGTHQLIALPGSPAGEVTADLVDVGDGTPEEFENAAVAGNLVLVSSRTPEDYDRWVHRREKYDAAVDGGAVGFLFRNHVPGCLPPTGDISGGSSEVGSANEGGETTSDESVGTIPAVGISRELGYRLARHCEDGHIEAVLAVDCRVERGTSGNVSGVLGPDTDREVLVTAHHDAHDIAEGARDNGCGCALVVTIASMLAQAQDRLETRVRFVTFGAEEVGLRGSRYYAETADLDGIEAVVNCDAIGSTRDLGVYTNGFGSLAEVFEDVADDLVIPITVREELAPHSDHWPFVRRGVPGVMASSIGESDDRGWGHTHGDTLDKVDWRDLRELAIPLAAAVLKLAGSDRTVEHVDPAEIERRAEEEGRDIS